MGSRVRSCAVSVDHRWQRSVPCRRDAGQRSVVAMPEQARKAGEERVPSVIASQRGGRSELGELAAPGRWRSLSDGYEGNRKVYKSNVKASTYN
ncbi:uncharacterized protein A4U43_C08F16670 [Asparagus officinalis]|nr:uncharacterized protein A4U43_C08F16670 [Asparagus officinalis]